MAERVMRDADDFLALSKACKRQAPELRKELNRGLRSAARPLISKTREAFRADLPKRGGLNLEIARRPLRIKVATGADPGISVVAAKTDARLDDGRLVHPVFGRRPSVVQQVPSGLFSGTLERESPAVIEPLNDVLQDFADRLARG